MSCSGSSSLNSMIAVFRPFSSHDLPVRLDHHRLLLLVHVFTPSPRFQ